MRRLIRTLSAISLAASALVLPASPAQASAKSRPHVSKRKPAAQKTRARKAVSGVAATVRTDGAMVYKQPDFDAEVLGTLRAGQRVLVSRGVTGQYAKFHKVKVGKTIGYIADIDVAVVGGGLSSGAKKTAKNEGKTAKDESKESDKEPRDRMPIYFTRYVGLLLGQTSFKEDISGVDANESLLTYGVKVTGPDVLIEGPILDFNVLLHYGAPEYYSKLSATKPSGFILWSDLLLLIPFVQHDNWMVTAAAGPLLVLSNFKVTNNDRPMDLTALNVGVSFSLGAAVRFERMAVRLESKYQIEKKSYTSLLASVQSEF